MKIQVNSDKTIAVDESLTSFVKAEVGRVLERFASKVTRVEVHLSGVNDGKSGRADNRCLVEVRPAGAQPLSASANAIRMEAAVSAALGKAQRSLTTFFGKLRKTEGAVARPRKSAKASVVAKVGSPKAEDDPKPAKKVASAVAKKAVGKKVTKKLSARGPKKKRIYQARREAWPKRK